MQGTHWTVEDVKGVGELILVAAGVFGIFIGMIRYLVLRPLRELIVKEILSQQKEAAREFAETKVAVERLDGKLVTALNMFHLHEARVTAWARATAAVLERAGISAPQPSEFGIVDQGNGE